MTLGNKATHLKAVSTGGPTTAGSHPRAEAITTIVLGMSTVWALGMVPAPLHFS